MGKYTKLFFSINLVMVLISIQLYGQSGLNEDIIAYGKKTESPVTTAGSVTDKKNAGQSGSIEGIITDKKNQETLIGTNVVIDGTMKGTITDAKGYFQLTDLAPGIYKLRISYVSYAPVVLENIKVEPNKTVNLQIALEETAVGLADVTVKAVRRTNTENAIIVDIKNSPFVSIGVSAQQISKTLDKDAAEVVKRIPGITVMDDRFLIVRGLAQRYNSVWLNNSSTPSSEADVKAFSFDVVPSSLIDNIMIYKSPAAELPADFSGGFVKITTKSIPEKNGFFVNYSTSYNQGTRFNTFYKSPPIGGFKG